MILYKYYGFNSGLSALKSSRLGFRAPVYFNDPFELTYLDNVHKNEGHETIPLQWRDSLKALSNSVGILSLTRTPTNPLMWAHYGEEHKGFVIGYDVSSSFFTSKDYNLVSADRGDVIYTSSKTPLTLTTHMKDLLMQIYIASSLSTIPLQTTNELEALIRKVFLIKPACWSYEEEVRIVKMIDDFSMTTEERDRDIFRSNYPLSQEVAPGHSVNIVEGLRIFNHQAPIREVYLGLRNPLIHNPPYPDYLFTKHNTSISSKSESEKWQVNYLDMKAGSWELEVKEAPNHMLNIHSDKHATHHRFSISLENLKKAYEKLPLTSSIDKDLIEFSEWNGSLNLRLNGEWL